MIQIQEQNHELLAQIAANSEIQLELTRKKANRDKQKTYWLIGKYIGIGLLIAGSLLYTPILMKQMTQSIMGDMIGGVGGGNPLSQQVDPANVQSLLEELDIGAILGQ